MAGPVNQDARLSAIDDVQIEAAPDAHSKLLWFYGTLVGLPNVGPDVDPPDQELLHFKSDRLRLRIRLCTNAVIEAVDHRLSCEVSSLEGVARTLDEKKYPYQWLRGMQYTDRAVSLLDPGGNRVMLRQRWGR